jgi:Zn-dependent protease with chaperone function
VSGTDFFDRQEASHRATRWLVVLFALAFVVIALVTGILPLIALYLHSPTDYMQLVDASYSGNPLVQGAGLLLTMSGFVCLVMIVASLIRMASLSQGGGHVARSLGGRQIAGSDQDPLHRRLVNVVEEMAIASGLPVPEIYVLESERGINAFAAGRTPADAAIGVTRGALEQLTRDELQGVVAHEFSHILNGDMRLNTKLMGYSFGILVLYLAGRAILRSMGRARFGRRGKGSALPVLAGLGLVVIGWIGVLLSRIIKAAVSRQREVLADASAVQFTREPLALAGALRKIGGFTPYLESVEAEEVSHMMFGRPGRSFGGLFATHPPLDERIRALDPSFKAGDYIMPGVPAPATAATATATAAGLAGAAVGRPGAAAGISQLSDALAVSAPSPTPVAVTLENAGKINPEIGQALRAALPADIVDAAHSSHSAWLLVLALGLQFGGGTAAERRLLETQIGPERARRCEELRRLLDALEPGLRLPLFELTVPALKSRPAKQLDFLFDLLGKLAAADGQRTLPEYLLSRMLKAHFDNGSGTPASATERRAAARRLLATLAIAGHADKDAQAAAYRAGLAVLQSDAAAGSATLDSSGDADFREFDLALARLQSAPLRDRRTVLTALAVTMRHDGNAGVTEAEIFRTIAAVLGCPVPPATVIG